MAQFGSRAATSRNACSDGVYANECRSAKPRSNPAWTADEHDVGKLTEPSFSGAGCEWCSSSAACKEAAKERARTVAAMRVDMAVPRLLCRQKSSVLLRSNHTADSSCDDAWFRLARSH